MKTILTLAAPLLLPLAAATSVAHAAAPFTFSPLQGIGAEAGIMRRDPSDIIRVQDRYYVWYSKGASQSGYDATIWYASSTDGRTWEEQGEAIQKGDEAAWDEQSVFTPNILVAQGKYWLFYTGIGKPRLPQEIKNLKTAIGLAVSDSVNGPWKKVPKNPILKPSEDKRDFDSFRVDDSCLLVRGGKYWLYYKGRQMDLPPTKTKMGLAVASAPGGPYVKHASNPLINGGHEVAVWPVGEGVAAMVSIGPEGIAKTIQFAPDGLAFSKWQDLTTVPHAAGMYRPEAFTDSGQGAMPEWGVHIGEQQRSLPFIERFDCERQSFPSPR